jgi:hypothetical protein
MTAEEHPDPRMRRLQQNLKELFDRQRELDEWSSNKTNTGTQTDADRDRYKIETRRIEQDRLANLKAIQKLDPSYRTAEIDREIRRLENDLSTAEESQERTRDENSGGPIIGPPLERQVLKPPPAPVLNAVKLMYAGAAVSTVSLIISLADISGTKIAIRMARPNFTATQVNQLDTFIITLAVVSGGLGIALWLWMAWANNQGKNWARILSTVLFGLATLDLIGVFSQPKTIYGLVLPVLTWLIGLGAVWLLWQRASSTYFASAAHVRE